MTTKKHRFAALGACLVAIVLVGAACVSGPLPPGPAIPPELGPAGFVEHEYFLDGQAGSYAATGPWASDGVWPAAPNGGTGTYRTRLIVRRPADVADFNGTVLVEWLNVSVGQDIDVTFGAAQDELLRDGYAYVGVSAQKGGVDALRARSRYQSLHHPGDEFSYDLFSQAGAAVRGTLGLDLLDGLEPQRVLAAGESQSAGRMVTYINAIHPLVDVFDGFVVYSRGRGAPGLGDGTTVPANPLIRTDAKEPIVDVQTEGDIIALRSHFVRQADDRHFRLWEVAGGSHADERSLSRKNPPDPTAPGTPCEFRANSASTFAVVGAAVGKLDAWVRFGVAPKRAPRIVLGTDFDAADPVVRDEFGLGVGGIRLPEIEVPHATIDGNVNPAPAGAPPIFQGFCRLFGRTIAFSETQLDALYPTHEAYVKAFVKATDKVVNQGFVLPEDGEIFKRTAEASTIGG